VAGAEPQQTVTIAINRLNIRTGQLVACFKRLPAAAFGIELSNAAGRAA
jgi:hypothetical protein